MNLGNATNSITTAGHFLAARGWAPATAGNYSVRLDDQTFAVTVSGKWKGELTAKDIQAIAIHSRAVTDLGQLSGSIAIRRRE